MNRRDNRHPVWRCRRKHCTGYLTLLGPAVAYLQEVERARERAFEKRNDFPLTFTHGSPLSCSVCGGLFAPCLDIWSWDATIQNVPFLQCAGDRPKAKQRRAAWQRFCIVCDEPFAMNGFWRKHGGCNNKGVCVPLEKRSQVHHMSMRTKFRTMADVARWVGRPCLESFHF